MTPNHPHAQDERLCPLGKSALLDKRETLQQTPLQVPKVYTTFLNMPTGRSDGHQFVSLLFIGNNLAFLGCLHLASYLFLFSVVLGIEQKA